MTTEDRPEITIETLIHAPAGKVWDLWTDPGHIIHWNHASDEWHTPEAENDLQVGGKFRYRMEARDGSAGFDFSGVYDEVVPRKLISYTIDDGRKVRISFSGNGNKTRVVETFKADKERSVEIQRNGWQAILDNFKKYAESAASFETTVVDNGRISS